MIDGSRKRVLLIEQSSSVIKRPTVKFLLMGNGIRSAFMDKPKKHNFYPFWPCRRNNDWIYLIPWKITDQ